MSRTKKAPADHLELGEWRPAPSVLAKVPDTEKEMLEAAKAAGAGYHAAVVGNVPAKAREHQALVNAILWKLNGGTNLGMAAGEGSPEARVSAYCAAAPGAVPTWGQAGEFLVTYEGMRVWVRISALTDAPDVEFNAVDLDHPFLSETGFRSHFINSPAWGQTVPEAVTEIIAGMYPKRRLIESDSYRHRVEDELPAWLAALDPPPSRLPPPRMDAGRPKAADVLGEHKVSLDNEPLEGVKIPTDRIVAEVTPGKVKAVKSATRRSDAMIFLAPDRLTILDDFNVRVESPAYTKRVRDLADDMKENGFRIDKPISCFVERHGDDNRVVIQDGHTRYKAALLAISEGAEIDDLPVVLLPSSTSMDDLLDGLVTTNNGSPLTMLETAIVVKRRLNRGASAAEISGKLKLTSTAIENLTILAAAPRSLQMMVAADQVSGSTVIDLISSIGAERAVKQLTEQLAKAQASGKSRVTAKHLPAMRFKQAVKRNAPRLYEAVSAVRSDPGYKTLTEETRGQLEAMAAELDQLKSEAAGES